MAHVFVIMRNGVLETYTEYDQIPDEFDHVIKFCPEIPPGPHSHEEHDDIDLWSTRLQRLMDVERRCIQNKINKR